MPTDNSRNKRMGYASSEVYVSLKELAMLEETDEIVLTRPKALADSDPAVNTSKEQKLPDFYELKIRVRKYDFL